MGVGKNMLKTHIYHITSHSKHGMKITRYLPAVRRSESLILLTSLGTADLTLICKKNNSYFPVSLSHVESSFLRQD